MGRSSTRSGWSSSMSGTRIFRMRPGSWKPWDKPAPGNWHLNTQSAWDGFRILQLFFELRGLTHSSQRGSSGDERAKHDVQIERVEAPPEKRSGKQVRTDYPGERHAKG